MRFNLYYLLFLLPITGFAEIGYVEPWGKDASLVHCLDVPKQTPPKKLSLAALFAEQMILFHHKVITPIDGPRSHFRPTSALIENLFKFLKSRVLVQL